MQSHQPGLSGQIHCTSTLAVSRARLWEIVGTMSGVNAELGPWVRMSVPAVARGLHLEDAPRGRLAFVSWVSLGGVLPFDRHALTLQEVWPGRGFVEESTSWLHRRWRHERTLEDEGRGCRITDAVTFEPRLGWSTAPARAIVAALFEHRHRRLRRRFGTIAERHR